jgi:CheY-like chemotaxis protein
MSKILVVDDDPIFTRLIKDTLDSAGGYEVMTVNRPSQAIAAAREFQPVLVVLDVMMPGMLGTEIASQMSDAPDLRHIKVIFLTGMRKKGEGAQQGEFVGGQHIIAKPLDADELLNAIRLQLSPSANP